MKNFRQQSLKAFTLIELLVVIAIIGLLATIVTVNVNSARNKALSARATENRLNARSYCAVNPGVSTLKGSNVYCDEYNIMWSITLSTTYTWGPETDLPTYANGDCNNLTDEDIVNYPACNACRTLSYAGLDSGWRLPTQGTISSGQHYCTVASTRDGVYCASNRMLWNLGKENCNWNPATCASAQASCLPSWDTSAVANLYWSSLQYSVANACTVYFLNGTVYATYKSYAGRVRCVLGQY
jgi:prepilin-type N-terminal cleavage/methylation domain-containing protein